jgi:hypothetical protein
LQCRNQLANARLLDIGAVIAGLKMAYLDYIIKIVQVIPKLLVNHEDSLLPIHVQSEIDYGSCNNHAEREDEADGKFDTLTQTRIYLRYLDANTSFESAGRFNDSTILSAPRGGTTLGNRQTFKPKVWGGVSANCM